MKSLNDTIKYECDNLKIIIYNISKNNNEINYKIKLFDKKNIFMLKKSQNFKRILIENTKNFTLKIGNKMKELPLNLLKENNKIVSKKIVSLTIFSLLSFGMINPVFANDLKVLDEPLIEMLEDNYHTGFRTSLDNKNMILEFYEVTSDDKRIKENREDMKKFYNEISLIKTNVIFDIKKEVLNILSKSLSKNELDKVSANLNKYYKNIDFTITIDSDDYGMNNDILSLLKQKDIIKEGYKYEMFLTGYSLKDIKNDKNSKKILYNIMLHELSHTIKGALSEDKTLLYDENIPILFQQKLGKKIEGSSPILDKLNNQVNIMELNEEFIMSLSDLEKTNEYSKFSKDEKDFLNKYKEKISGEAGVITYDNYEIYGQRTKFTRIDYLTMINVPKTNEEKDKFLNKIFKETIDGINLNEKNIEVSKVENNSMQLRNLIKYIQESNYPNKIELSNKVINLLGYNIKDSSELIKNILNSLKNNSLKIEYYPLEM